MAKKIERKGEPRMPNNILFKLFGFTILLFLLPVLSFFLSKQFLTMKNSEIYSGLIAMVSANLVILFYILVIFNDDDISTGIALRKAREEKKVKAKEEAAAGTSAIQEEKEEKVAKKAEGNVRKRK